MRRLAGACVLAALAGGAVLSAQDLAVMFACDRRKPVDLATTGTEVRGGAVITDLTYQTLTATRRDRLAWLRARLPQ
jgi:hypothetical protein